MPARSSLSARFDADAAEWTPAESIEVNGADNDGTSAEPWIGMDDDGNAVVVWHRIKWSDLWQRYVGVSDIWTARYTNR